MRNDTHTVVISDSENKIVAIMSGVPDECDHDDDGEVLHFNDEGKYWKESDLPVDREDRHKFMKENKINGGCVSCSKCGKPFTPDFNSMP